MLGVQILTSFRLEKIDMPIKKAAIKALRQSNRRKIQNTRRKNIIRSLIKELRAFLAEKKYQEAKSLMPKIYKALDKATKTGVIKQNTASRKKSRLTRWIKREEGTKTV